MPHLHECMPDVVANCNVGAFPCMQVQYVTIASKFVRGVPLSGEGQMLAKFAGAGYQQVQPQMRQAR